MDAQHRRAESPRRPSLARKADGGGQKVSQEQQAVLDLQRSAGNRAVADALRSVQRHSLNPEEM